MWGPYTSNYDNPILYKDPRGNEGEACCGGFLDALADAGNKIMISASGVLTGALNTMSGGLISSDPFNMRPHLNSEEKMYFDNARKVGKIAPLVMPGSEPVDATAELAPAGVPNGNVKVDPSTPEPQMPNTKQSSSVENTSTGRSSGRGSNNRKPDPNATGDHSVINKNGATTFEKNRKGEWNKTSNIDKTGAPHFNKKTGEYVPTPHRQGKDVNGNKIPGGVEPIDPNRMPKYIPKT